MPDDQLPPKPVIKRVVKKTAPTKTTPTVRYGRPVGSATPSAPKPAKAKVRARGGGSTLVDDPPTGKRRPTISRPTLRKPSVPKVDLGSAKNRLGAAGSGISSALRRLLSAVVNAFWLVVDSVRSWRLPRIAAVPASLVTGVLTGLVSVLLGFGALQLFSWLRGVSSGGGTWGTLTFVVVAFIAFVLGELLLSGFGVPSPRLTSFLGVVITIVLILGLFLEESDTQMALLVVPSLAATAFTIAHWLMAAAERSAQSEE